MAGAMSGGPGNASGSGGICGAKTVSGGICNARGMKNGRCKVHGGASLKGIEHPSFKHGGRSKYLRFLDGIDERLNDPKLIDSRRSIAAQEFVLAKCFELLETATSDEEIERLESLSAAAEAMSKAQQRYWTTALAGGNAISYPEFVGLIVRIGHILEEIVGPEPARLAMAEADREVCRGALGLANG